MVLYTALIVLYHPNHSQYHNYHTNNGLSIFMTCLFLLALVLQTLAEVHSCLQQGDSHRRRAATAMNDRSSRAHALFILTLRQTCDSTGVTRKSNLFLADLGGSEKVSKSGVKAGGSRLNQYQQTTSDSANTAGSDDQPERPVQPNAAVNQRPPRRG